MAETLSITDLNKALAGEGGGSARPNTAPRTMTFTEATRMEYDPPRSMSALDRPNRAPRTKTFTEATRSEYNPTSGMSTLDRLLAGIGKAYVDTGRGLGQMLGLVSRDDVRESRQRDAALMDTTAGTVGNVIGNVASSLPLAMVPGAVPAAAGVRGAAAMGSLQGLLQPSTSNLETAANIGLGGASGAVGQTVGNAIAASVANRQAGTTAGQRAAMQAGQRLGMQFTPGQASGSRALQRFEAKLESSPMTSGGFDRIVSNNNQIVRRAAARSIGENADDVSSLTLANAMNRLEGVFDNVADATPVPINPTAGGRALTAIEQRYRGLLNNNARLADNALIQNLDDIINNQGGATREQLRALSSNLGKAADNNVRTPSGDRQLGRALFEAQDLVEDAIQNSLPAAERQLYTEARGQYRNLMNLLGNTTAINPASGEVNARSLASIMMRKDRGGFTLGRNNSDLYDALRAVQAFPKIVNDSGTATRSMSATDYLAQLPTSLLARVYLSQPVSGLLGASGSVGGALSPALNPALIRQGLLPAATVQGSLGLPVDYLLGQFGEQ